MRLEGRVVTLLELEMILRSAPHLVAANLAVGFAIPLLNIYAYTITEFAHGKVDPHEAGKQGGSK